MLILPQNKRFTGKSVSEALILESVNPQYDERLFIEFQEKYKLTTYCVQKLFLCFCFDIFLRIQCTISCHIVGYLTDARMRASEKDLPVKRCVKPTRKYFDVRHSSSLYLLVRV